MGNGVIPFVVVAMVPIIAGTIDQHALSKRNALDYPDYVANDEYPVISKRAALLFDRLMVALKNAVDKQSRGKIDTRSVESHLPVAESQIVPSSDQQTMDLQRRGQAKGRVYWRCYFNAVTCFRRK